MQRYILIMLFKQAKYCQRQKLLLLDMICKLIYTIQILPRKICISFSFFYSEQKATKVWIHWIYKTFKIWEVLPNKETDKGPFKWRKTFSTTSSFQISEFSTHGGNRYTERFEQTPWLKPCRFRNLQNKISNRKRVCKRVFHINI